MRFAVLIAVLYHSWDTAHPGRLAPAFGLMWPTRRRRGHIGERQSIDLMVNQRPPRLDPAVARSHRAHGVRRLNEKPEQICLVVIRVPQMLAPR